MEFITFAQGKEHLQIDHDLSDDWITENIEIATAVVVNYLKQDRPRTAYQTLPEPDPDTGLYDPPYPWPWPYSCESPYWWPVARVSYQNLPPYVVDDWIDTSGHPLAVPGSVQAATKLVLGVLYKDREGAQDPISPAVESLLRRYRDPAMA